MKLSIARGQWTFVDSWAFVRFIPKQLLWYLRFFYLPDTLRPLGTIKPSECTVAEMEPWPIGSSRELLFGNNAREVERAKRSEERRLLKEATDASQKRLPDGTRSIICWRPTFCVFFSVGA